MNARTYLLLRFLAGMVIADLIIDNYITSKGVVQE